MFDIGWSEMLVIGVIAIVVVGPKDLPRMMRTVGQYVGKAKRMAREFQSQFDAAVRESELDEVRKSFDELKSSNPSGEVGKALNPLREAADDLKKTVDRADKDDDDRYGTGFENPAEPAPYEPPEVEAAEAPEAEGEGAPDDGHHARDAAPDADDPPSRSEPERVSTVSAPDEPAAAEPLAAPAKERHAAAANR